MTSELRDIPSSEWKKTLEKLTIYASHKCLRRHWETPNGVLSKGNEPKDLALEAISKVLSRERKWDPEEQDLLSFLKTVVDSMVSHLVASPDNARRSRGRRTDKVLRTMPAATASPEQEAVATELTRRIRASLDDAPELLDLFNCIAQGDKPKEIARALGQSIDDIYNQIRKLKRRLTSRLRFDGKASKRA